MMTEKGRQMTATRVAKTTSTKAPGARLEVVGGHLVVHDTKPKNDKTRWPSATLFKGDSITLDFGGVKVWCYTTEQYTEADKFQWKLKLALLLRGRSPWLSKKALREVMTDV